MITSFLFVSCHQDEIVAVHISAMSSIGRILIFEQLLQWA